MILDMSGLKADYYVLTPALVRKLLKGGRNTLLRRGQILDGVGAIFLGSPPGRNKPVVTFMIREADTGKLADMGGRYDPHHKNSIEVLQDEVYEESATTLKIGVTKDGHLILNERLDLTDHPAIILDTYGHRGNKVYRVFVFDVGDNYSTDLFNTRRMREAHNALLRRGAPKSYIETSEAQHITLKSIKKALDENRINKPCSVSNMNKCVGELRPRTARIFRILFMGSE